MRFLDYSRHSFNSPPMRRTHPPQPDPEPEPHQPTPEQIAKSRQLEHDALHYPPHLQWLAPTPNDLDLVQEAVTGKPVTPESAAAGVAQMQQRIQELEAEKAGLLHHQADDSMLDAVNRDLATARERLAHYQAQLGHQN
jgi:hypothetical protein